MTLTEGAHIAVNETSFQLRSNILDNTQQEIQRYDLQGNVHTGVLGLSISHYLKLFSKQYR